MYFFTSAILLDVSKELLSLFEVHIIGHLALIGGVDFGLSPHEHHELIAMALKFMAECLDSFYETNHVHITLGGVPILDDSQLFTLVLYFWTLLTLSPSSGSFL